MKKKYFLCAVVCMMLIFSGFGLSYANNTCPDNEKNISSSLGNLNNLVKRIDMNNLLQGDSIISENESSQSDEETAQSEVCEEVEETQEIAEYASDEQLAREILAENKTADESPLFDFIEEFNIFQDMHSSLAELPSK